VRNKYQRKDRKSNHKFEVIRGQELLVRVPLPMAEVWAEMQAQVEELTGQAGLQILRAILENEGRPPEHGNSASPKQHFAPQSSCTRLVPTTSRILVHDDVVCVCSGSPPAFEQLARR
jgi:hypothetical protein